MKPSPNPLNAGNLVRATRIGLALSVSGVLLFIALWVILEPTGIDHVPRLVISVCLPPALIALVAGGYFLLIQPRHRDQG